MRRAILSAVIAFAFVPGIALAGAQQYEQLSASVRASLSKAVGDPDARMPRDPAAQAWVESILPGVTRHMNDEKAARDLLALAHYEAQRAGLEPRLVVAIIDVESAFRKYAVSAAGARGYMQVMPFWVREIGVAGQSLFHPRTNLRYGCVILRHYLEIENGNLYNALARYNGSLGKSGYPERVLESMRMKWSAP